MKDKIAYTVRREQSLYELKKLKIEMTTWLGQQDALDCDQQGNYVGRQKSRIAALRLVFLGAAVEFEKKIAEIDISEARSPGDVYKNCRDYDQSIVWLQRIFVFYRDKFDQRADTQKVGPLLEAADEMIWSCYREVYKNLPKSAQDGPAYSQKPPPLPYIAQEYSPAAWDASRDGAMGLSYGVVVPGLDAFINNMPVPLMRLPPWCVGAAWWLIYIAHEVGHIIQPNLSLVKAFRDPLVEAARKQGFTDESLKRWNAWSEEIFADLFSMMMVGSAAGDALAEVEWSSDAEMIARREKYPPRVARLWLADATLKRLGMKGLERVAEMRLEELVNTNPEVKRVMETMKEVPGIGRGAWSGALGPMTAWCNQNEIQQAYQSGEIRDWAKLLPNQAYAPSKSLSLPRKLVTSGFYAWKAISAAEEDPLKRQAALEKLNNNLVLTVRKSGPIDETRAGSFLDVEAVRQKDALIELLQRAGQQSEPTTTAL